MKKGKPKKKKSVQDQVDIPEDLLKLAKRLQSLRAAKGYSSYEYFAYEHEISRTQYGRYEAGKNLTFTSLVKVVKGLGVTLEEFFSEGFD